MSTREVTPPIESTRTVDFRETVDASTGVEAKKPCPIDGYVTAIIIHWPLGCSGLVQVAVVHLRGGVGGTQTGIVPTDSGIYLALEDTTPIFNLYFPVKRGDYFMAVIRNTDNTFAHTISVDIVLNPILSQTPTQPPTQIPIPLIPEVPEERFPPALPEIPPEFPDLPEYPSEEDD